LRLYSQQPARGCVTHHYHNHHNHPQAHPEITPNSAAPGAQTVIVSPVPAAMAAPPRL